jgi:hypothetical protein
VPKWHNIVDIHIHDCEETYTRAISQWELRVISIIRNAWGGDQEFVMLQTNFLKNVSKFCYEGEG